MRRCGLVLPGEGRQLSRRVGAPGDIGKKPAEPVDSVMRASQDACESMRGGLRTAGGECVQAFGFPARPFVMSVDRLFGSSRQPGQEPVHPLPGQFLSLSVPLFVCFTLLSDKAVSPVFLHLCRMGPIRSQSHRSRRFSVASLYDSAQKPARVQRAVNWHPACFTFWQARIQQPARLCSSWCIGCAKERWSSVIRRAL